MDFHTSDALSDEEDLYGFLPNSAVAFSSANDIWPRDDGDAIRLITESFDNHIMGTPIKIPSHPSHQQLQRKPQVDTFAPYDFFQDEPWPHPDGTSAEPLSNEGRDQIRKLRPINTSLSPFSDHVSINSPFDDLLIDSSPSNTPLPVLDITCIKNLAHQPDSPLLAYPNEQAPHDLLFLRYLPVSECLQHQNQFQQQPQSHPQHQSHYLTNENLRYLAHLNRLKTEGQCEQQLTRPLNSSYVENSPTCRQSLYPILNEKLLHVRLPLIYSSHSDMSSQLGEPPFQDAASHFSQLPVFDSPNFGMGSQYDSPSFQQRDDVFALPPIDVASAEPTGFSTLYSLSEIAPDTSPQAPAKIIVPPTFKFDGHEDTTSSPTEIRMRSSIPTGDDANNFDYMSFETNQDRRTPVQLFVDPTYNVSVTTDETQMLFPGHPAPSLSNEFKSYSQDQNFLDPNDYHTIRRGRRGSHSINSRLRSHSRLASFLSNAGILKPQSTKESRLRLRLQLRLKPQSTRESRLRLTPQLHLHLNPSLRLSSLSPSPSSYDQDHSEANASEEDDGQSDNDEEGLEFEFGDESDPERRKMLYLAAPVRLAKSTQKNPSIYQCHLCSKRFTRPYNLKLHLRTHTDDRPFLCAICNKAFARQHDRKRHQELHLGAKKYQCRGFLKDGTEYGCGRKFARADALRRHFQTENGKECVKVLCEEARRDGVAGFDQVPDPEGYATTFEVPKLAITPPH